MNARNALGGETSPYLLQHAGNPVDWLPWGPQAFARARELDRPVFLSVGYSTCHWCHVMARESFEDSGIAEILNAHFVSVKVDREERPDVDRLYMAFVQTTTGAGGWPMSVWLTPDGAPFFGGTYFPPEDRHGRPGFPRVLLALAEAWQTKREALAGQAAQALAALTVTHQPAALPLDEPAARAERAFADSFDAEWGGFGGAPKFPRPAVLGFLFGRGETARAMAIGTLRRMALGGLHDALGGGFHRYSVDRMWHVPHFEKMLYDQAQIAAACLDAWQLTARPLFRSTALTTLDYLLRDLASPEGGFCAGEDADSAPAEAPERHVEGAFYVWDEGEVRALLDAGEAAAFCAYYNVRPGGNVASDPHGELAGCNVLLATEEPAGAAARLGLDPALLAGLLERARRKLAAARAARPRPHRDGKILAAWNGLAIGALARAGAAFAEPRFLEAARRAAHFLHGTMVVDGRLLRSWHTRPNPVEGFAEDYAFVAAGLLDLYEATGDIQALRWALALQQRLDTAFWGASGYFTSTGEDPLVRVRTLGDHDGAEPLADSVAARNLLRMARMGLPTQRKPEAVFAAWSVMARQHPTAFPALLAAWQESLLPPRQAVLVGNPGSKPVRALLEALRRHHTPGLVVLFADGGEGQEWLASHNPALAAMQPGPHPASLHLCEDFACRTPVHDPGAVDALLGH